MSPENKHHRADFSPTEARNLKEIIDGREFERFSPERKAIP